MHKKDDIDELYAIKLVQNPKNIKNSSLAKEMKILAKIDHVKGFPKAYEFK